MADLTHGKSHLRTMFEKVSGHGSAGLARAKGHMVEGGHAFRQAGESVVVGGLLGYANATLKTGLDVGKVPIDAVVGVLGLGGRALMAHDGIASDLGNAGAAAAAIFTFRKTQAFVAAKRAEKGLPTGAAPASAFKAKAKFAGEFGGESFGVEDFGEDPILAAARAL